MSLKLAENEFGVRTRRSTYSLSDAIYDLSSERKCEIVDSEVIFGTEKFVKGERERERESNVN